MKKNLNIKDVKYVKLIYFDRWDAQLETKAAITKANSNEISVSAKTEERIFIKTPQVVELNLICNDGIYKTTSTIKYVSYEEPYMIYTLSIPQNVRYQQNREYFRVKIIEGAILSFDADEITHKKITCKTRDISANGVCIELPERINIPDKVTLTILFDNHNIVTDAKFIRIDSSENTINASFRFINISQRDVDYISKCCITKQLEDKRDKYDN